MRSAAILSATSLETAALGDEHRVEQSRCSIRTDVAGLIISKDADVSVISAPRLYVGTTSTVVLEELQRTHALTT